MKHHTHLQELIHANYFEQTPVICQDLGIIPGQQLSILTQLVKEIKPYEFQGVTDGQGLSFPSFTVGVEDEESVKYYIPDPNRIAFASFTDTKHNKMPGVGVFEMGFLAFNGTKISSFEESCYASYTLLHDQCVKLTARFQQQTVNDVFRKAITGLKELYLLRMLDTRQH